MNEETNMNAAPRGLRSLTTRWGLHRPRKIATKFALGIVATTLIASSAIPAFAGKPHREGHGARSAQQQTEDVDAAGKRKGKKGKTVKKTFANDGAIAIPGDGNQTSGIARPYPSGIAVTGFKKAKITDLNLTLRGFGHEFPRDVDLLLVAPGGRNAVVMSDVGNNPDGDSDVSGLTLRLDDEATTPLPLNALLASGAFQPNDDTDSRVFPAPAPEASANTALSSFDGINPNGQWQLFIVDNGTGDTGAITDGWSLEITAKSKGKNSNKKTR
jgi:subtilisin-like proprotein convertase family protein